MRRQVTAGLAWLRLYPLLWVAGFGALFWPVAAALNAKLVVRARLDTARVLILVIIVALIASAPFGLVTFGFSLDRSLGLLANLSVWFGILGYCCSQPRQPARQSIRASIALISAAQAVLIAAALVAYPGRIGFPVLSHFVENLPSSIAAFSEDRLAFSGWLGGRVVRSAGMMGQPTWSGGFGAVALIVLADPRSRSDVSQRLRVLALIGAAMALALSWSRATWAAMLIAASVAAAYRVYRRSPVLSLGIGALGVAIWLGIASRTSAWVADTLASVNSQREGSASTRGAIYQTTFDLVGQHPLPIVGYGIKPSADDLVANVASHSAIAGALFRGGILAALAIVGLLVALVVRSWHANNPYTLALAVFLFAWSILEDLDVGHLAVLAVPLIILETDTSARSARVLAHWEDGRRSATAPYEPAGLSRGVPHSRGTR